MWNEFVLEFIRKTAPMIDERRLSMKYGVLIVHCGSSGEALTLWARHHVFKPRQCNIDFVLPDRSGNRLFKTVTSVV